MAKKSSVDELKKSLQILPRPKLLVFDLDYTIWPFWCDTHVCPPFKKINKTGQIVDRRDYKVKLYPEIQEVFDFLKEEQFLIAAASRTETPDIAQQLLDIFCLNDYFHYKQIYPGCKVTHLNRIKQQSGLEYNEIVFFDDEYRNIRDVTNIGVVSQYVEHGVNFRELKNCFEAFREKLKSEHFEQTIN